MVTTRRNADDGTTVNEAEKRGPSQPAPPIQPNDEFNEEAEYDEGYNEEEGYDYPMDEETPEVELLRQQMANQQRAMEAQAANMAAMQEMMRSVKAAMDAMKVGTKTEREGFVPILRGAGCPRGGTRAARGPAQKLSPRSC